MVKKRSVSKEIISDFNSELAREIDVSQTNSGKPITKIVGIERGGVPLAKALARELDLPSLTIKISYYIGDKKQDTPVVDLRGVTFSSEDVVLIVDDLVDTGGTVELLKRMLKDLCIPNKVAVYFYKPHSTVVPDFFVETTEDWIVFPWEQSECESIL